jgi:hypothetical protein
MALSYQTFKRYMLFAVILLVCGVCYCTKQVFSSKGTTNASISSYPTPPVSAPVTNPVTPAAAPQTRSLSTDEIRAQIATWLETHQNRNGKMKQQDILPDQSFRATAVRFPTGSAEKWSDDPNQWSQIRLDLNRDGTDDEKWLLKMASCTSARP